MVASKGKGKHLNEAKSYIREDVNGTTYSGLSGCDYNFGDIAWVRTGSYSWWPAEVADESSVSPSCMPRKKADGEVLVRLYGTYNYLYINPVKTNEEFQNTMRQNNLTIREMLEKALEEDLSRIKSRYKRKGNLPPPKEHVCAGPSDVEIQDRIERNEETDLVTCVGAYSVKDGERGTNCTEAVDKARVVASRIKNPMKYNMRIQQVRQKDRNCTEEREKARDVGSKVKNPRKYYVRKQQVRQKDKGGIHGDMNLEEDEKRGMNCSKNVDKASNFDSGNKKFKKIVNRKQPVAGMTRYRTLGNLHEDEVEGRQVKLKTGCEVRQNQDGKPKRKQQDVTKRDQDEDKEQKVKEKAIQGKKRKLRERAEHVVKFNSKMQDRERKSKQKDGSKHGKVDVHDSVEHVQVGKTPDPSARRMKVMQTLALIAPSGSPFCKSGNVKAASCKS